MRTLYSNWALYNTYFQERHIVSSSGTVKYSNEQPHTSVCGGTDDFCLTSCSSAGNFDLLKEDCIAYKLYDVSLVFTPWALQLMLCNVLWWIMLDSKYFLADSTRCTKHYGGISSGVSWCYLQQRHSSLPSYPHHGAFQQCSDCDGTSSRCWVILPIFSHLFQQYSWLLHWCHKWRCEQQPVFLDFIHPRAKWIPNSGKSWCIQLLHSKEWVHCHMALWEHIKAVHKV